MESVSGAQLSMDCEDMFKEITKKLYGEEAAVGPVEFPAADAEREFEPRDEPEPAPPADDLRPEEHITAWGLAALMQNGFPPPGILQANFTPRIDPAAEDRWTAADEPLAWAHSRIAAYNPAQRLFKCAECECVGFLSRVAEHWLGTHSGARAFHCPLPHCGYGSSWARCVRQHLARDHRHDPAHADQLLRDNPALDDLTRYLQRLKAKVDAARTRPQEPAPAPAPTTPANDAKRYVCAACPYATDRRDLFTRHENIHRDEKPFHCYLCSKQFNRADHVKKHFLRMHRDHPYDLNRIRRSPGKTPAPAPAPQPAASATHYYSKPPAEPPPVSAPYPPRPPPRHIGIHSTIDPSPASAQQYAPSTASRRRANVGTQTWCRRKRHLNTHLKPFACALCEYKAARAERLATHVHKVHNKKACARCPFLADDQAQLTAHLREQHHIESRNIKVPGVTRCAPAAYGGAAPAAPVQPATHQHAYGERASAGGGAAGGGAARRREVRAHGAARLFGYLEASDGSADEYEPEEMGAPPELTPGAPPQPITGTVAGQGAGAGPQFAGAGPGAAAGAGAEVAFAARDKENAAPPHHPHHHHPQHHTLHHDHCLRY
ncbi:Protein charlatan [Eumeta japonica]|uniref:Protein charlatan n=1 Tax=Eumeta variegata TaxID=151549 RepID=A0A4C1ZJG9_EUMVA|nr:Protein charlatan [Eumeta japonica]